MNSTTNLTFSAVNGWLDSGASPEAEFVVDLDEDEDTKEKKWIQAE